MGLRVRARDHDGYFPSFFWCHGSTAPPGRDPGFRVQTCHNIASLHSTITQMMSSQNNTCVLCYKIEQSRSKS